MAQSERRRSCGRRPVEALSEANPSSAPALALTVLGSSCSIPRPGRACSSYLIEGGGTALVVDLGTGAFANLIRFRSPDTLEALVVSHMHADHFLDILPLRYALKYGARTNEKKLRIYLPPTGDAMLRRLCSAFAKESGDDFLGGVFEVFTYDPAVPLHFGAAVVTFAPADHFIPTYAVRCDIAGASVAYSSDTAPSESVAALAHGADVFVCEATLRESEESEPGRGHMSAREAGAMAARAAAERLLLTHYSAAATPSELVARARTTFHGTIDLADDGYRIEV